MTIDPQPDSSSHDTDTPGRFAAVWTMLGIAMLFAWAAIRLALRGLDSIAVGLSPFQAVVLAASVAVFFYGEGVLALQRRWIPRVIRRAQELSIRANPMLRVVGPLYGMSLVGDSGRGLLRGWGMVLAIFLLVGLVRLLPDPWRGIIDLGVASALAWGLIHLLGGARRLARNSQLPH